MPKRQISITLDSELLDLIDQLAKETHYKRSEIIEYFVRKGLREYEDYHKKLSLEQRTRYDIMDRIFDELIRKFFGEKK